MTIATAATPLSRLPLYVAFGVLAFIAATMLVFRFAGEQRLHNTALWQRLHPIVATSAPQVATPVEVVDAGRVAQTVVQTDKGLYFLTGVRYVPATGTAVVVQVNDGWDLFLCVSDGSRCMTIHSFCADIVWSQLKRDTSGRAADCFAPRPLDSPLREPMKVAPLSALPGSTWRSRPPPAVGVSHPREWVWRMGLPINPPR